MATPEASVVPELRLYPALRPGQTLRCRVTMAGWGRVCGWLLIVATAVGLLSVSAHAANVKVIAQRLGQHAHFDRFVLELERAVPARAFLLHGPPRAVIDLPALDWPGSVARDRGPLRVIKRFRTGRWRPDIYRVVIELEGPAQVRRFGTLPASASHGPRLLLDLAPVSHDAFMAAVSHIEGERDLAVIANASDQSAIANPTGAPTTTPLPTPVQLASLSDPINEIDAALLPLPMPASVPSQAVPAPADPTAAPAIKTVARLTVPWPVLRPAPQATYRPLVVIDPGHGGVDPGAVNESGMLEKDITLAMGIVLRDLLAANPNYRVRLTRDQDVFLRLRERYRFAQDHAADLFISLHADSLPGQKVRGASVYVLSEDASDAEADALAVKENASDLVAGFELAGDVNDVGSILIDLSMRENQSLSNRFANQLVASLRQETDLLNRPKRSAGFAVLKSHDVPSVLLEMGYLSDADDAALLIQGEYRRRLAHAIVHAIEQYFAGPGVLAQR